MSFPSFNASARCAARANSSTCSLAGGYSGVHRPTSAHRLERCREEASAATMRSRRSPQDFTYSGAGQSFTANDFLRVVSKST